MKKLIKKGGALILALFLFILSPVTAFGYGTADSNIVCGVRVKSNNVPVYMQNLDLTENGYFVFDTSKYKQSALNDITLTFTYKYDIKKADVMAIDFVMARGRYLGFDFSVDAYAKTNSGARGKTFFKNTGTVNRDTEFTEGDFSYDYSYSSEANSSNTFHVENTAPFSYNGEIDVIIQLSNFQYSFSSAELPGVNLGVEVRDISASVESPESGIAQKTLSGLSSIIEYVKNIFTKIGELPSAIGKFVTDLGNKISGLFSNLTSSLSGFFTNMTNSLKGWFENIGSWFTELGNNIKQWFTNLTNNLKKWFDNIGQWFTDLGNDISSWFNKLFNKLWWGNENGESEYQPPVFSSGVTDVLDKIQEYIDSLENTLNQIDGASASVSAQIKQATGIVDSFLGVVPSSVIALITFGIVFIFSRKVVGR